MQSQETLINPGFGVSASFQGCHQKTEKEGYFQMDSVEIPRLFHWKCNLRAKCFYSVGLILHNCCHLYLSGALIVLGCSEAARNAVLTTSSSVTTTSASRWSGSATARRTARWARTRETAKEQVKKPKRRQENQLSRASEHVREQQIRSFAACVWNMTYWRKSSVLSRGDWASRPTGVWAPGQHGLSFTHESALRSSLFLTCSTSRAADLTPAAFPVLPTCSVNEYVCASGGCVSASLRCDGHDNCLDGSDEVSAPPTPLPFASPPTAAGSIHQRALFPQPAVATYPLKHQRMFRRRCGEPAKGSNTCCFLSPQIGCVKECREDEFLCLNRAHCIPRRWRCDDVFDCMDHSDEENCSQGRRGRARARARAQTTARRCDADGLINDITAPRRTSDDFISGLC